MTLFALLSPCSACHQFLVRLQKSGGLVCERRRRFDQLDAAAARLERKKAKRLKARRLPASATRERILAARMDKELADEALRRYAALHERANRKAP